ncbi:MAG: hypothetical protein JXA73_14925 [Acidobacteria bacterium]|nr:hypothetical protein [Acidobacteriota bacterium]
MNAYDHLLARIRQVRARRRAQVLVKGLSLFLVSAIALLIFGVWGADLFGFSPAAVWSLRLLTGGAVLFVAWYFLYVPLRSPASDVQIAQFIEERYPQLEDRLVTAVEFGNQRTESFGMIDLLIADALDKSRRVDFSVFLNRRRLMSFGAIGIAASLALFALFTWGPSFFPYGFNQLYFPWTEAARGSFMTINIMPGDIEIPKGMDQEIQAQLIGFDSPDVRLYTQNKSSNQWNSVAMTPDLNGSNFRYLLIDISDSFRYYVESTGIRSQTHSIDVKDLAGVEKLILTYRFPPYTGMSPQVVEDEGDISALKGTRISFKIRLNKPVQAARLFFDNRSAVDLVQSGPHELSGDIALQRSGSYVIQAAEFRGNYHAASPEYAMEAMEDSVPEVVITRPMKDVRATNVEEVFAEIRAEDDIGIAKLDLHYSVNGAPEKAVNLSRRNAPQTVATGSHTFFLEELGLRAGDLISYYGKATDNNNVTGPGISSSDIYFIQIRPFEQKYIQNQAGAPPGGGEGEEAQEALSKQQKDIISATFKLIREKDRMPSKEYLDGLKSLALVQSRLQLQAQGLVDRLQRRGAVELDENFRELSEYLRNAIREMGNAAVDLGAQKPDSALPQEQKSLQQLMRAESLFREIQVSFGMQNAAGGAGSQADADDLADLFELELNKLKNQYETIQRGEKQTRDEKVDEALQRLKELARRQQQLNERNRMLAQQGMPSSAAGSGNSNQEQQQLMEQAEQLRRQLQRLSRERSSPQLNEAGNQLQKAIEEMKKALKDSQNRNNAETGAQGMRALQQLNDAARRLARNQNAGLSRGVDQAVNESRRLIEEQNRIRSEADKLAKSDQSEDPSDEVLKDREELVSRKTMLAERLRSLKNQIRDLSRQSRRSEKEAGNKLDEAAGTIDDKRLPERILNGSAMIRQGFYENQRQREDFIRDGLEEVNRRLESAQRSIGQGTEGKAEEAADRARQLAEGLESMQQRLSEMQRSRGSQDPQGFRAPGSQNQQDNSPNSEADVRGPSGDSVRPPVGIGGYRNDEEHQLSREMEQRLMDAQELRRLLDRNSTQMENLDKVIESLRRAGDYTDYNDPEQIARLKRAIDYMRKVEFDLARNLDRLSQDDKYFSTEDNEAPRAFQKLVDEYFRSIAKTR